MPPTHDTRLLNNLLKTEKDAQNSFNAWTKDAASASAALSAWSVADSGDTQDLMDVSHRLTLLLAACSQSQRVYLQAISAYRQSLKDILAKEQSVKTVIRDREILVGRLIKLGNKKPADKVLKDHESKLEDAQRELAACEAFLQDEEASLSSAKRQTFKESLAIRMKAMGELGRTMEESANEAIEILSSLGQLEDYPAFLREAQDRLGDDVLSNADSITPSHSASQALSKSSSVSSLSTYEDEPSVSHPLPKDPTSPSSQPTKPAKNPARATSPSRALSPSGAPASRIVSPSPSRGNSHPPRSASTPNGVAAGLSASAPASSRPIMAPVPTAPRTSIVAAVGGPGDNIIIPKAPTNVMSYDDSSDEEDDQATINSPIHPNAGPRSSAYGAGPPAFANQARLRKKAMSEDGSIMGSSRSRRGSFFGAFASLFSRKKDRSSGGGRDDDSIRNYGGSTQWDTRTSSNIQKANRASVANSTAGWVAPGQRRRAHRHDDDSSGDDDMPRNLVRVVNNPKDRMRAFSDAGRPRSLLAAPTPLPPPVQDASGPKKVRKVRKAASDIGVGSRATVSSPLATSSPMMFEAPPRMQLPSAAVSNMPRPAALLRSPTDASNATSTLKKKKKKVIEPTQTLVITATPDMIPPSPTPPSTAALAPPATNGTLSRSNTVTTTGTAGTKKKKKRIPLETVASSMEKPADVPPTAEQLGQTLPSARNSMYAAYPGGLSPSPTPQMPSAEDAPGQVPKSVGETAKRAKKDSIKYGSNNWVAAPAGVTQSRVLGGPAQQHDESLMAIVDRDQRDADAPTSRNYGATLPVPVPLDVAIPRTNSTATSGSGLAKRKSVRLAELSQDDGHVAHSPPASVRSDASAPTHGILVNNQHPPPPSLPTLGPPAGWDTRVSSGRGMANADSSEEDDEDPDYAAAKKAFARGTKGLNKAISSELKGKKRAE